MHLQDTGGLFGEREHFCRNDFYGFVTKITSFIKVRELFPALPMGFFENIFLNFLHALQW